MLAYFKHPLTWRELLRRTIRAVLKVDAQALAAQLAFYFLLALFPALLCLITLAGFFPLEHPADDVSRVLTPLAPAEVIAIIRQQMLRISQGQHAGLFGLGLVGAIWSSSSAMTALVQVMNRAYDIEESRPWWRVRIRAILLTLGLALFVVASFTLVVAGPEIAGAIAQRLGLGGAFMLTWAVLEWPVAFALVCIGIDLIYCFAPDADQEWVWITPGSVTATLLWLLGSLGFRYYAITFGHYGATYGAIGGIILLLLWFYLTGLVIIVGAEMNAEIDHASPWSHAPARRVPGEKLKIGPTAARAFERRVR